MPVMINRRQLFSPPRRVRFPNSPATGAEFLKDSSTAHCKYRLHDKPPSTSCFAWRPGTNSPVDLLHSSRFNRLDARDRNLTHEMVMGVGRLRIQLDFLIEKLSGKTRHLARP